MTTRLLLLVGAVWGIALSAGGQTGKATQPASDTATSKLTPKKTAKLGEVTALYDVEYARVGTKSLLMDIYLPPGAAKDRPAVVWIHGGGWLGGSKDNPPALPMTGGGFVVVSITYRFSQEAVFPAQIEDCKAAVRFVRAHAGELGIDPKRLGAWGASAGGHLAALLGTTNGDKTLEGKVGGNLDQSSDVQAVVDWFGPADFSDILARPDDARFQQAIQPVTQLLGGKDKALAQQASPAAHAAKDAAPMLIMHGDKDNTVPISQSQTLAKALKDAGADVTFITVNGSGHGFRGNDAARASFDFLAKHLAKPTSAPAAK